MYARWVTCPTGWVSWLGKNEIIFDQGVIIGVSYRNFGMGIGVGDICVREK